jgi:hypothetical protein
VGPNTAVTVEEARGGKAFGRFVELPFALHHQDPRWAPPVVAYERWRLDPRRNPYFEEGDAVYLLARRMGRPAGRMSAHLAAEGGDGWFGFFDAVNDAAVLDALVEGAKEWLTERGCTSMTGPASFALADEAGVQVSGHEIAGVTGRQWHPEWYAQRLEQAGFQTVEDRPTWRLPTECGAEGVVMATALAPHSLEGPPHAGAYGDPRLVLEGIAAVPDVAAGLRESAWALARRAKARDWEGCTIVRCDGDPAVLVPQLRATAGAAGYQWVIAPWSPDVGAPPEAVHRVYRLSW